MPIPFSKRIQKLLSFFVVLSLVMAPLSGVYARGGGGGRGGGE